MSRRRRRKVPGPDPPHSAHPASEPALAEHLAAVAAAAWQVVGTHTDCRSDHPDGSRRKDRRSDDKEHLAAELLPAALQPFMGWSDRRRLPADPMLHALDTDDAFRASIAEHLTEERCGLLGWMWLTRPDNWQQHTVELVAQHQDNARSASEAQAAQQQMQQLATEAARAERHAATATKKHTRAAADTKRRQRAITETAEKVHAAQAAVEAAQRNLARAHTTHQSAEAAAANALQQQEQAATQAQQALDAFEAALARLEAARPAEPEPQPEPETDHPTPSAAAADTISGHQPAASPKQRIATKPPQHITTAAEQADHLVRAPNLAVLIDGYNYAFWLYGDEAGDDLVATRHRVDRRMHNLAARRRLDVTVVWDGIQDPAAALVPHRRGPQRGAAKIRFSRPGRTADDSIIAECGSLPDTRPILVVTRDRALQLRAARRGANTLLPEHFSTLLPRPAKTAPKTPDHTRRKR